MLDTLSKIVVKYQSVSIPNGTNAVLLEIAVFYIPQAGRPSVGDYAMSSLSMLAWVTVCECGSVCDIF